MATYGENFSSQTPSGIRPGRRPIWGQLWFQVVIGMAVGIALGHWQPNIGAQMKPFGDIFILLIRMMIAPIIFCTVVHGIAGMNDMRRVGRVALKALIYFEVITTAALIFALVGVNLWQPGVGMHVNPHAIDTHAVATYANQAKDQSLTEFFLNIVPKTFASAFTQGEVLQVLFVSLLFAFAASALGPVAKPVVDFVDILSKIFFRIIGYIMYIAPIGAFGALAFTVGKFGAGSLASLGSLIAEFFVVSLAFTFIVLGGVAWWAGVSLLRLLNYIRDELVIVAATTSSETVLPRLIEKLRLMGCEESVVGLVIPTGYSFNLDGTCLYLATAAVFLAQATDTPLDLSAQIGLILVLLLTSKGAAGVAGAAFIVLAASLGSVGGIPIGSIALILGIHRILAEALTFVNVVGNCVATIVVSKWEGALNHEMLMATIGRRGAARPASLSKAA